jgi:hypothetical protein
MKNSLQLSKTEISMMKEVSEIFAKYKSKTRQFGIQLVHSHFPISPDEILYETHDANIRTMTIKPIKKGESINALVTAWEIKENGVIEAVNLCCTIGPPPPPSRIKVKIS